MAGEGDKTVIRPRPGGAGQDPERTIVRPRPGGDRAPAAQGAPDVTRIRPRSKGAQVPLELREAPRFDDGTVVDAAASLLSLAAQIPHLQGRVDVEALHRQCRGLVSGFDRHAEQAGIDPETIRQSRYMLCSLLDELVLNTQWGEHSDWSRQTLLRTFHQETYGGERVFRMIEAALGAVRKNYPLLELAHVCLSLGFLGKHRADAKGRLQVEKLRGEIYQVLNQAADGQRPALTPAAAPLSDVRRRLHSFLPVWILATVLAVAAGGLYAYLDRQLDARSARLTDTLAGLVPPAPVKAEAPARQRPVVAVLRRALAPEIQRGVVSLDEREAHVAVVLQAAELFDSASADIDPALHPVLDKIAKALERTAGTVVVAGHTDSMAINTPRFPSNWHLSLARASAVVKYMAASGSLEGRLLPEGRADSEPVASNDTAEGRARNRRVTIEVSYAER